ncbi:MAG: peptide MFS transporter [Myxococcales bacterium]|jgi:POT family proton-dependent oligopeptide transporter|nr:peptide MFS transporter [Myxococcales bacterium]
MSEAPENESAESAVPSTPPLPSTPDAPAASAEDAAASEAPPPVPVTRFEKIVGHPPGLFILFFTEMWERFSFYGMRGLLKGYMMYYLFAVLPQKLYRPDDEEGAAIVGQADSFGVIGWDPLHRLLLAIDPKMDVQGQASLVYGLYNGLVYLTPVIGGYLADKYFGQRKIVMAGAVLMAAGEFMLGSEKLFFFALLVLIVGNGAFKPNISTQVGNLYREGDKRRDRAYSIFYVGINVGSFICNFICGTLAAVYGWRWGFFAAGVGLLLGLVGYVAGQRYLASDNLMKSKAEPKKEVAAPEVKRPLTKQERLVVISLCALCALNVPFWVVYEQQGNTMQTWADKQTIWPTIGSFHVPTTWFQSFNPLMIVMLTPVINMLWAWQERRGKEPSTVSKMAIGSFVLGGSFIVMVIGAKLIGAGKGSVFWPFFATLILTVGELYLSPIGLSLVTKAAPARMVSLMMGIWFVSSFLGGLLSGVVGVFYTKMPRELFFLMLMVIGVATGAAMWAFNKPLKKALGDHA